MLAERSPHEIMILAIHLRAPTFSKHNVARNLKQKISEEEYSSRISISRRRNSEILVHCEWYEAPSHLSECVIRGPDLFRCPQSYSHIGHSRSLVLSPRFRI